MRVLTNFEDFIDKYPTWIIYMRGNKKFKCPACWDEPTSQGNSLCPTCYGTGYSVSFERLPSRITKPRALFTPDTETTYGNIPNYDLVVYLKSGTYPKMGDKILEASWNVRTGLVGSIGQPTEILHVYTIDTVIPMREDEISYFSVGCFIADSTKWFLEEQLLSRGINA